MTSLADVFRVLHRMRDEGIIRDYAVGGAAAVMFYAEPTLTYDVDVFVTLPSTSDEPFISLAPIYTWAEKEGFTTKAEHLMIHGVPVQFLPAYNALVVEALQEARDHEYDEVNIKVMGAEHLVALALQAGGSRRRERAWRILETGVVNREHLKNILTKHAIHVEIPDDV